MTATTDHRPSCQHRQAAPVRSAIARTPITINPRVTAWWLLAIAVTLTVLSLAADAFVLSSDRPVGLAAERIVDLVDLDAEANAPAFFSTLLLAGAGTLLGVVARHRRGEDRPDASRWALLSILFFALSFDEAASVHETMIGPFRRLFPGNRFVYFGWVVPGTVFVIATGSLFARFLLQLDRRTRDLFVLSGFVYVGGALGIEVVEGYIASGQGEDNWTYVSALTVQELLEMGGVILFIYAILDHLRRLTSGLDLAWTDRRSETTPSPG